MLSWITGAKSSEESTNAHFESFIEAPETPAPVFAVRAFKHAIFGTPKPAEAHDQFDDIAANMPSKLSQATTAESENDPSQKRDANRNITLPDALGLSPSKPNGILMTPGTTRRNKTVTFGAQVVDNEGKKPSRSGLPNSFPGKFPSPWTPKTDVDSLGDISGTSTASQKRTKLTQTLHEVRDSSRAKNQSAKTTVKSKDDMDITLDFMEPRSQSGKYWKQEYDAYSEKTQREVKKLLLKQKAAKDYAKDKDVEISHLTSQLREATGKVERLEARSKELELEMHNLRDKLLQDADASASDRLKKAKDEAARLRLENWKLREGLERTSGKSSQPQTSPRKRPISAAGADIWADAVISSPFVVEAPDKSPGRSAPANTTPRKNGPPLRQRDINTLEAGQSGSNSKRQDRTTDVTPKRSSSKRTPRGSRDARISHDDSLDMSLALPEPSLASISNPSPRGMDRTSRSARTSAAEKSIDEPVARYSPTRSIIMSSPPPKFDRLALPMGMPSGNTGSGKQQNDLRSKPSLTKSFAKATSPRTTSVEAAQHQSRISDQVVKSEGGQQKEADDGKRKTLSEEKKLAALKRIAVRRAEKGKA